jgi:hypothetical protein
VTTALPSESSASVTTALPSESSASVTTALPSEVSGDSVACIIQLASTSLSFKKNLTPSNYHARKENRTVRLEPQQYPKGYFLSNRSLKHDCDGNVCIRFLTWSKNSDVCMDGKETQEIDYRYTCFYKRALPEVL